MLTFYFSLPTCTKRYKIIFCNRVLALKVDANLCMTFFCDEISKSSPKNNSSRILVTKCLYRHKRVLFVTKIHHATKKLSLIAKSVVVSYAYEHDEIYGHTLHDVGL